MFPASFKMKRPDMMICSIASARYTDVNRTSPNANASRQIDWLTPTAIAPMSRVYLAITPVIPHRPQLPL